MKKNPPSPFRLPEIPARLKPYLRLGTCSWKYDSWKGLVYDRERTYRPNDYLADYARFFNSVEVDQWFWSLFPDTVRLPEVRTVKAYAAAVPDFFDFLRLHNLGFVYLDGYFMPPIGEVYAKHKPRTAAFQVVRLHGGDRGEIEKETGEIWDGIVAPKPAAVEAAIDIVVANAKNKIVTTININNHFEGSAPLTAANFLGQLERRT